MLSAPQNNQYDNNNNNNYNDNYYHEDHNQEQPLVDTVIIGLPRGFSSWFQLPANPLIGQRGIVVEGRSKHDYKFYCDACQKGFMSEELYTKHVGEHLYCEVPGCNFTCRKDRSWKMDMHVETLHSRIDAPNLADGKKYVEDRRRKFPTTDVIEARTEELMLKASRGEILPDERRRWLRRYGVVVRRDGQGVVMMENNDKNKKWTEDAAVAADEDEETKQKRLLEEEEANKKRIQRDKEARERREARLKKVAIALTQNQGGSMMMTTNFSLNSSSQPKQHQPQQHDSKTPFAGSSHHRTVALSDTNRHLIPMGANGRLTKTQQVQLVRDRYRAATRVPNFYVCNRCGLKGVHWIEDCPKTLEFHANALERRMRREREQHEELNQQEADGGDKVGDDEKIDKEQDHDDDQEALPSENLVKVPEILLEDLPNITSGLSDEDDDDANSSNEDDDDDEEDEDSSSNSSRDEDDNNEQQQKKASVLPRGTRVQTTSSVVGTVTTTFKNDDAAVSTEQRQRDRALTDEEEIERRRLIARRRLRDQMRVEAQQRHSGKPSLLDRMMEDSKLASSGLLLQAMRFFVANNFFESNDNNINNNNNNNDDDDDESKGENQKQA